MRCFICNYADFSGRNECHDQSEEMKGRNAVHWRNNYHKPGKGEFICNHCFRISEKHRRFYLHKFNPQADSKESYGRSLSTLILGPAEAYRRKKEFERSEQEDKEVAPAVSKVPA